VAVLNPFKHRAP